MKRILSTLLLLAVCAASASAQVSTGSQAPDFALKATDGKTYKLTDFKGKYVVLEWVNYGCPFVRKHYESGNMQSLQQRWTGKDVVWLSICSSAPGKQGYYEAAQAKQESASRKTHSTAYLLDSDGKVGREYGAKTTPHMFVVNPKGQLIYQGAIDSIASANPSDIDKATNYVDAALNAAMAGKPVAQDTTRSYGCSVKY